MTNQIEIDVLLKFIGSNLNGCHVEQIGPAEFHLVWANSLDQRELILAQNQKNGSIVIRERIYSTNQEILHEKSYAPIQREKQKAFLVPMANIAFHRLRSLEL